MSITQDFLDEIISLENFCETIAPKMWPYYLRHNFSVNHPYAEKSIKEWLQIMDTFTHNERVG